MKKEFDVKGMHCKSCEMLIKDTLEEVVGIKSAFASSAKEKVIVDFDPTKTDEKIIISMLKKEGYRVINSK
ncbi:MAG: heavy metal-associated domain-containing protein [Candidatus Woesearchaeota archaeon]